MIIKTELVIEREGLVAKFSSYPLGVWNILSDDSVYGKWGYNEKQDIFFISGSIANTIYVYLVENPLYEIVSEVDTRSEADKSGRWDQYRKKREDQEGRNRYNYNYNHEYTKENRRSSSDSNNLNAPTSVVIEALSIFDCDGFSSEKEVKAKYRNLVKLYHPDRNPNADPNLIKSINSAWDIIKVLDLPFLK